MYIYIYTHTQSPNGVEMTPYFGAHLMMHLMSSTKYIYFHIPRVGATSGPLEKTARPQQLR